MYLHHMRTGAFLISCLLCLAIVDKAVGQLYERFDDINVTMNGNLLANPWAGGLNSCQVSTIDVNLDGKKDIFIFDRIGSRISIFINQDDTPGAIDYKYTRAYNYLFPSNLRNWVLLRDMNCDGKEDICSNSGSGFRIHWNQSTSVLAFSAPTPSITSFYDWGSTSNTSGVYSISPDIPALEDYDNDGDMDMWSWNEFSTGMFFYKNMAVENGDCSFPAYECRNRCYGMFGESSESSELFLGENFECDFNVADPRSAEASSNTFRHTGGTTLTIDLDQNGLKDLILGDVTGNSLFAVMLMESSNGQDSAFAAQFDFPAQFGNTLPAEMTTFLGAFYVDVNNDAVKDLLISPNSFTDAEDKRSLMLYINEGENDLPQFVKIQDDFLQDGMIDLGNSAYPVVFDVDQDGIKDLLIANRKYFELGNNFTSIIQYYRNTGTTDVPVFELVDDNWLNIPAMNWLSVYPAFGDLNGDGAPDLVVGDQEGVLHFMENASPQGQPVVYNIPAITITDSNNEVIDIGQNSTPQLFDVDNDGLNDLLIGELNGCVNYFRNTGTSDTYSFVLVEDSIGNVAASSLLGIQGRSVPHMIRSSAGLMELFIGTETGQINHYNNIEGNLDGEFNLLTSSFENIIEGEKSSVFFSDLTGDGLLDFFVGNIGGGIGFYRHFPVGLPKRINNAGLNIYPNPATTELRVNSGNMTFANESLRIYDMNGRCVLHQTISGFEAVIDIRHLPQGVYIVQASGAVGRFVK